MRDFKYSTLFDQKATLCYILGYVNGYLISDRPLTVYFPVAIFLIAVSCSMAWIYFDALEWVNEKKYHDK